MVPHKRGTRFEAFLSFQCIMLELSGNNSHRNGLVFFLLAFYYHPQSHRNHLFSGNRSLNIPDVNGSVKLKVLPFP